MTDQDSNTDDQHWLRVELLTTTPETDSSRLMQQGSLGIETQDHQTFMEGVEIAPVPEGKTRLIAFFEARWSTAELRRQIESELDGVQIVSVADYSDRSWETAWMKYFEATKLSKRVAVGPPWDEPEPPEDGLALNIEPGMAFGTGTHETTRSCARLLDERIDNRHINTLLDVGCGSAILSMLAAGLGVDDVIGIDIDERAIEVAETNLEENGFSGDNIDLSTTALTDIPDTFDIVVANILAPVLLELQPLLLDAVEPGGDLILSGISDHQLDEVTAAFDHPDFNIVDIISDGDWRTLHLRHRNHKD